MIKLIKFIILALILLASNSSASVDTLSDTTEIYDGIIYSYANCNSDVNNENCRRYNGGKVVNLSIGLKDIDDETRALFMIPGWDGTLPDSAKFEIFCYLETDAVDRKFFIYPLTKQIYEGTENGYNIGGYPEPDSGATWSHAWLDVGDNDSLNWTTSGGDYLTAVACTALVTHENDYFSFHNFERILNYWDTSGNNYGFIMINQNSFPNLTSSKIIRSSEGPTATVPNLLLFYADSVNYNYRRRQIVNHLLNK